MKIYSINVNYIRFFAFKEILQSKTKGLPGTRISSDRFLIHNDETTTHPRKHPTPLEIEQIFYYTKTMSLLKNFWHWINPIDRRQLLVLELDPANAQYLAQIAAGGEASPEQIAQELLKTALLDRQVAETNLARWQALTPRQQQVAALACLNFTNRQIAAKLSISPQTVKSHMRNLLHRFDLHSKTELRQALENWDFSEWVGD
jgi:DNA-binding CsgD family transcriptional regulator